MGLLANKDNELNAGQALESMLDKFGVDLDKIENDDENSDDNEEINKRRKNKIEKEKLDY